MLKKFMYVKDNEDASERKVIVFTKPTHLLFGLDVSNKTDLEIDIITKAMSEVMKVQKEQMADIVEAAGLSHRYRAFKEDNIVEIDAKT